MDPALGQNALPELHRQQPVNSTASLPAEFWRNVDSLYAVERNLPLHRQQQHQPHQEPRQQEPSGFPWDHSVLQEDRQQPEFQTHQNQQNIQQDNDIGQSHGIYTSSAQTWSPDALHQQRLMSDSQGFSSYHAFPQFSEQHVEYESRSLNTPDGTSYQGYPFAPTFYSSSYAPGQDSLAKQLPSQDIQSQNLRHDAYQQSTHSPQYSIPPALSNSIQHPQVGFSNDFNRSGSLGTSQQTIDPVLLNTAEPSSSQRKKAYQDPFVYIRQSDFEQTIGGKSFQYQHPSVQIPSTLGKSINHQPSAKTNSKKPNVVSTQDSRAVIQIRPAIVEVKKKKASMKKPALAPKKATTKGSSKKSNRQSTNSSANQAESSEGSDLDIVEPEEPSPLPLSRPTDSVAGMEYDTLKVVWSPRNRVPSVDRIKAALNPFKDIVKGVRDDWKEKSQAMKEAAEQGDQANFDELRKEVNAYRLLMDAIVTTTLEKGHPHIVEKLGTPPHTLSVMYSFLLDRHQQSDLEGTLTVNILKLLSKFSTIDEEALQKTNLAKILPRFVRKGGQTVKELSQKILDNTAAATKRMLEAAKQTTTGGPAKLATAEAAAPNGDSAAPSGVKRGPDGDSNSCPATKKAVTASNVKTATKPSATNTSNIKRPSESVTDAKTAAPARPKSNLIAPKPTNLFGTLSSASKRPGTSNAERAAAAAAAKASTSAGKREPPSSQQSKPAFSFGDIMADLNKGKEPVTPSPAIVESCETEEERQRRLRKQARRKLRVSWKPDDSLTEVRLFTHDPAEELGPHDGSQAGDVKGEGSVLKLHRCLDELEDDDEGVSREEVLLPYQNISEVDLDDVPTDERSRNFVKRSGFLSPHSTEMEAQNRREATTLMVFYTSSEVPPSPKEPPLPIDNGPAPEQLAFGVIPDYVNARQERYYSFLNPKSSSKATSQSSAAPSSGTIDIANLLKIIQSGQQQQQQQAPALPQTQPNAVPNLEHTIMFPQPQTSLAQPQIPQATQFPNTQPSQNSGFNVQKALSLINTQSSLQQPTPSLPQISQPQTGVVPNLAAIISQFAAPTNNVSNEQHEDLDRKRAYQDGSGYNLERDDDRYSHKKSRPNPDKEKKYPKTGLVLCRYWAKGNCIRGSECTFRHDPVA